MKTIDLSKVGVKNIEGITEIIDISKGLANAIYKTAGDIEEHNFSLKLYENPEVGLTDRNREIIMSRVKQFYAVYIQQGVENLINYEDNKE